MALGNALELFWHVIEAPTFAHLCRDLLRAEGVAVEEAGELRAAEGAIVEDDARAEVLLDEPGGSRRGERWAFRFRHDSAGRVSAGEMRRIVDALGRDGEAPDVVCLLTSGDLTSIGNAVVVGHPRLRVWDRSVLHRLINRHLETIGPYFPAYLRAVGTLSAELERAAGSLPALGSPTDVASRLRDCPPGRVHAARYEDIGIETWEGLFSPGLGPGQRQRRTADGGQRRDVLFRNTRSTPFWRRVADDHDGRFVIVDFKNYGEPVQGDVINDVNKYANKAVGRFIVVVSRGGGSASAATAQRRVYAEHDIVVLVVGDALLLEMAGRQGRGEAPEDVLEDLLDGFLMDY